MLKLTLGSDNEIKSWNLDLDQPDEIGPVNPTPAPPPTIRSIWSSTTKIPGQAAVSIDVAGGEGSVDIVTNWGDGVFDGYPAMPHQYQQSGTYTIVVTAKDSLGRSDVKTTSIRVDFLHPDVEKQFLTVIYATRIADLQKVMAKKGWTMAQVLLTLIGMMEVVGKSGGIVDHNQALDWLLKL